MLTEELKLNVQEPWFTLIKQGKKSVEGRSGTYDKYEKWIGKIVEFYFNEESFKVKMRI